MAAIAADQTTKKVLDYLKANGGGNYKVIEEWHEGTEWYRVWSSGLIEQGGVVNASSSYTIISFHKPFVSPPFRAVYNLGQQEGSYASIYNWTCIADTFMNSSMSVFVKDGSNQLKTGSGFWYACGY